MAKAIKDRTQDQRIADLEDRVSVLISAAASADPTLGAALVKGLAQTEEPAPAKPEATPEA